MTKRDIDIISNINNIAKSNQSINDIVSNIQQCLDGCFDGLKYIQGIGRHNAFIEVFVSDQVQSIGFITINIDDDHSVEVRVNDSLDQFLKDH